VASWERQGLEEITLLTTNGNARNIQALAMVIGDTVRVRSVDTRAIDVSRYLTSATSDHAGEFETSIMLYLAPELVRESAVEDLAADVAGRAEPPPVRGTSGVVGTPSAATAKKGLELYEYLVDSIVGRLGALDP
jgi:creatinine amidohydrolase/Fe(II)-dependent formamide hydrolase-like protein